MKKILLALIAVAAMGNADQLTHLKIEGMMCPACVKNVKGSLNDVAGVKDATVYLKEGKAQVTSANGVKAEVMCDAVKKAGYGCSVGK
ncbi:MAG: heavy metal-associated domain-containing protein [Sulfuricurvum sp.]|jgi:copper chaperone CopZ